MVEVTTPVQEQHQICFRLSERLETLSQELKSAETALLDALPTSEELGVEALTRIQRLDYVQQGLEDLSKILLACRHINVDLSCLTDLKLQDSKRVIDPIDTNAEDQNSWNKVDLF